MRAGFGKYHVQKVRGKRTVGSNKIQFHRFLFILYAGADYGSFELCVYETFALSAGKYRDNSTLRGNLYILYFAFGAIFHFQFDDEQSPSL